MLRLPILTLKSRETNRLSVVEVNNRLGCDNLPVEIPDFRCKRENFGEYVVYYNSATLCCHKATFLLVRVDGYKEQVLDEGDVEDAIQIYICDCIGGPAFSYFVGQCKLIGKYCFNCVVP